MALAKILEIVQERDNSKLFFCYKDGVVRVCNSNLRFEASTWCGKFVNLALNNDNPKNLGAILLSDEKFELKVNKAFVKERYEFLVTVRESITDKTLQGSVDFVLSDVTWQTVPASLRYHEIYPGGQIIHTSIVVEIILQLLKLSMFSHIKRDVVLTAAFWHDFGKTYTYNIKEDEFFERDKTDDLLGHVATGFAEFWAFANCLVSGGKKMSQDLIKEVSHCILASHGHKEWDAVVEPQSCEAWLLHLSDMLATRVTNPERY